MSIETHAAMVQRLKSEDYEGIALRKTASEAIMDMDHAITGIFTEGGEMADALKKHFYYGTELDLVNLREECGDVVWYLQLLLKALDTTLEEVMDLNEAKLVTRYGGEFSEAAAVTRDLVAERKILEAVPVIGTEWEYNIGDVEECPVPEGTLIDLVHRDGDEYLSKPAGVGCCYNWVHMNASGDIIKWRLAQPTKVMKND